jgi:hypothetical protein
MSGMISDVRDERTVAVEDASYRLAYAFVAFALLLDVMYRSFVFREAPWELLAIVIVGGAISAWYQGWHKVLTYRSALLATFAAVMAGIVAAVIAGLRILG